MHLFHQHYPCSKADAPVIVIIPGLFGSTSNWRSVARALSEQLEVYVVDQRNHGQSAHADSQSYFDMADDLLQFVDFQGLDSVIVCGHSMGGKTAMVFSMLYPERVQKMIALDIAPINYRHDPAPFLEDLMSLDLSQLKSRKEADLALRDVIPESSTRLFLLQNLTGRPGEYSWRINLTALNNAKPSLVGFPDQALGDRNIDLPSQLSSTFIYGAQSDYVLLEHHAAIKTYFAHAQLVKIDEAGHWLHADQPQAVIQAVLENSR